MLRPPKMLSGPEEGRNGVQMPVEGQLMAVEGDGHGVREIIYPTKTQFRRVS